MAQTPNSNASSYLTVASFLTYVDWRTVAEYCSDDEPSVARPTRVQLTTAATVYNNNLQAALDAASGMLEAACTAGGRYDPTDLAALTGVSAAFRDELLAGLALAKLYRRRPDRAAPADPRVQEAMALLEALEEGRRVFSLTETQQAGVLDHQVETPEQAEQRNLPSTILRELFGRRMKDIRQNPAT